MRVSMSRACRLCQRASEEQQYTVPFQHSSAHIHAHVRMYWLECLCSQHSMRAVTCSCVGRTRLDRFRARASCRSRNANRQCKYSQYERSSVMIVMILRDVHDWRSSDLSVRVRVGASAASLPRSSGAPDIETPHTARPTLPHAYYPRTAASPARASERPAAGRTARRLHSGGVASSRPPTIVGVPLTRWCAAPYSSWT
jgi:hypothetical protein